MTGLIILVLIILGVVLIKNRGDNPNNLNSETQGNVTTPNSGTQTPAPGTTVNIDTTTSNPNTTSGNASSPQVKSFTVTGKNFSFTPGNLTVNKGDTVKITFINANGMHDWNLDEFNAHTGVIQGGQTKTIEFVANKAGSFEYYCSVGTHRQMGMKGTLTVK